MQHSSTIGNAKGRSPENEPCRIAPGMEWLIRGHLKGCATPRSYLRYVLVAFLLGCGGRNGVCIAGNLHGHVQGPRYAWYGDLDVHVVTEAESEPSGSHLRFRVLALVSTT